jgi:hypothetical protein
VFESAVLSQLREIDPRQVLPAGDAGADALLALRGRLAEAEGRLASIRAELVGGGTVALRTLAAAAAEREAERDRLAAADARQSAASPLADSWGECRTLLDALAAAGNGVDPRSRLRGAIRRITERIDAVFVRVPNRLVWRAGVQMRFVGGGRRSFLIEYRPAGADGAGGRCLVESFAEETPDGDLDLGDPTHARVLAEVLRR